MTIDEAIKLYKDLERINREEYKIFNRDGLNPKSALITAQRYEQLVEWLKKLKAVKQIIVQHDSDRMPEDYWYIDKIREVVREVDE